MLSQYATWLKAENRKQEGELISDTSCKTKRGLSAFSTLNWLWLLQIVAGSTLIIFNRTMKKQKFKYSKDMDIAVLLLLNNVLAQKQEH